MAQNNSMDLPIKLISTDFDGTLFSEFETPPIPEKLVNLIGQLQSQGVKWVINTGRDMASLMESLGRSRIHIQPDFLVLVEREIYQRIDSRYAEVEEWNRACAQDHLALFARVSSDVKKLEEWINARFEASVYEDPHSPLCVIAANNGDMNEIHAQLNDYCTSVPDLTVVRNDVYARFSHRGYNKGTALAQVSRLLKVDRKQVFAMGDHLNDLPMLTREFAAFIAAPSNSVLEVAQHVSSVGGYICQQPAGDGVLEALNRFLSTPSGGM